MKVDTNPKTVAGTLERGVINNIVPSKDEFLKKLLSGERLRFYIGIDSTATDIHLGHAGNLLLLEDFRQLGHEVVVLLGDFTALVGDPTGKDKSRPELSKDDVEKNINSLKSQVARVVKTDGENPAQIKRNSEWLSKLSFSDILDLARSFTAQQMLERDMFKKRIKENSPIYLHEFLYPLLQGYDSVALDTDVEVGGTDQLFNMMTGRTLLERIKSKNKFVVTTNLLENPKTGVLMSKSEGTGIFLGGSAIEMFGVLMAQEDEMMRPILINSTRLPLSKLEDIVSQIKKGGSQARDAKLLAAEEVVSLYYSKDEALEAREAFVDTFTKGDLTKTKEVKLPYLKERLFIVLVDAGLVDSNTESKRLVEEGAVEINGKVVKDPFVELEISGTTVRVGKHRFARLVY